MGSVVGRVWEEGVPEVPPPLRLQQWSRDDLISMMGRFRAQEGLAVRLAMFSRIMGLEPNEAQEVWNVLGLKPEGTVDVLSIAIPMIAMSRQEFISRVTFLFSVCDFNSDGSVRRSELVIGLRSLFKGLARFFPTLRPPMPQELEAAVDEVIRASDTNKSGELELDEILTVGYRCMGLRALLAPFPVQDDRVFESLIAFAGARERLGSKRAAKAEGKMRRDLMLCPEPFSPARSSWRRRPWTEPRVVSRPRSFLLWAVFADMATQRTMPAKALADWLTDRVQVRATLEKARDQLDSKDMVLDAKVGLVESMLTAFLAKGFAERLEACGAEERLSFRALAAMLWPNVPDRDVAACLKWARQFQAFHMVRELTKKGDRADSQELDVTRDDVDALFEVLDVDGDGKLTAAELQRVAGVDEEMVGKLMEMWDRDGDEELTKGEIMSIIWGMSQVVRQSMHGLFAASASAPEALRWKGSAS